MKAENPRSTEDNGRDHKERHGGELPVEVVSRKNSCGLLAADFAFPHRFRVQTWLTTPLRIELLLNNEAGNAQRNLQNYYKTYSSTEQLQRRNLFPLRPPCFASPFFTTLFAVRSCTTRPGSSKTRPRAFTKDDGDSFT